MLPSNMTCLRMANNELFLHRSTGSIVARTLFGICAGWLAIDLLAVNVNAQTYVTNFTTDNNIYTNLNQEFPNTGAGVPGSGVGVPNATFLYDPSTYTSPNAVLGSNLANNGIDFLLSSDSAGQDFMQLQGGQSLVIPVSIANPTAAYTLMSAYFGTSVNVTFTGSGGATETFNNIYLPDFNGGGAINQSFAVNGSVTDNLFDQTVFQVQNVGAGGSGNSSNGAFNTYDLVEQTYLLDSALIQQGLSSITITANGNTALVLGLLWYLKPPRFSLSLSAWRLSRSRA